jgi:hypothetical protein
MQLCIHYCRDNWINYRGPGFLAVVCLGYSPTPSPHRLSVSSDERRHTGSLRKRDNLLSSWKRWERGWGRSQIILRRECLLPYISFNTLRFRLTVEQKIKGDILKRPCLSPLARDRFGAAIFLKKPSACKRKYKFFLIAIAQRRLHLLGTRPIFEPCGRQEC